MAITTTFTIALVGNPNTGKSTLFSALVGMHQHVGNYPGVTVEKKIGRMAFQGDRYEVIDLPGLYSLAPRSRDEMVTVDVLLGRRADLAPVDAVVCIVDASNLARNLYLASQVLDMGLPTVVAVNMLDVAARRSQAVDLERLQMQLGVPVVGIQANRGTGLGRLKEVLAETLRVAPVAVGVVFPEPFECEVDRLEEAISGVAISGNPASSSLARCFARRLLLDTGGALQQLLLPDVQGPFAQHMELARARLAAASCAVPGVETDTRYRWVQSVLEGVVDQSSRKVAATASDRIDRVLTHRLWGTILLLLVMVVFFHSVFVLARPFMDGIDAAIQMAARWIEGAMADGALRSLLVDGVLAGVGGVLAFLPQILILFALIAVLEDCGYMARAAFLMDRLMARVGLSGRSFLPMLSSFACAVPGIMATRVIDDQRDRLTTILVAPLLTCSARLPVYALLIAAFIPAKTYGHGLLSLQGLTLAGLYLLGIVAAIVVALLLKRTVLRGPTPPFLMELPSYKCPSPRTIALRVIERAGIFVRTASGLILAVSVIIWAVSYYPYGRQEPQRNLLGQLGHVIEPAIKPLGWDWRIGCAVIASFPARELVVANLSVIYGMGHSNAESADDVSRLHAELRAATWEGSSRPVFTVPVALSIMVFFALCAQCAATLAVIRRETNSWRWPLFAFSYMTVLAYLGALVTYQFGSWISG